MIFGKNPSSKIGRQYLVSLTAVVIVAGLCYPAANVIGYRSVALLLLGLLSLLSLRMSLYPMLAAATVSALIWNYFFIPPQFTFHISSVEDGLMFAMYFIVALLNGVFSARIRRAEELARQKEERANAAKLYDTMFNSLSHELRTPIATIWAASDNLLAEDEKWSDNDRRKLNLEIHAAAERLNRLVDNLLNMSRLESGTIQPKKDWCDLNELVFTAVNRLENELKSRQVTVNVAPNLPLVQLDFGLVEQAIFNVLYNASIYTPEDSPIVVDVNYVDNQCVIKIADNGPGFREEDLERVFEKFYRSKGSKPGGTGLGLSITKGFLDAQQGSILAENKSGGGAVFTLRIPAESKPFNAFENE